MEESELPSGFGNKWDGLDCTGSDVEVSREQLTVRDKSLLMNVRYCSWLIFCNDGPIKIVRCRKPRRSLAPASWRRRLPVLAPTAESQRCGLGF